jgi:hypothetical protein
VKSDAQTTSAERDARSFLLIGRNILGKSRTEKLFVRRRETKNAVEIITNGRREAGSGGSFRKKG